MKHSKSSHAGHLPLRTCVGCRQVREKRRLLRIVRASDGTLTVDDEGTAPGRGAYVCRNAACVQLARKRRALDRSLRIHVPESLYDALSKIVGGNDVAH
ncbi:MAG: YlxR family protein [Calditrichaeota bacterium]|nr:YlxR family protein [Calditrichota bacterium]